MHLHPVSLQGVHPKTPTPAARLYGRRHGLLERLLPYASQPWATGLASFVTTAIILLPIEYEIPLRSLMLFVVSRRF